MKTFEQFVNEAKVDDNFIKNITKLLSNTTLNEKPDKGGTYTMHYLY